MLFQNVFVKELISAASSLALLPKDLSWMPGKIALCSFEKSGNCYNTLMNGNPGMCENALVLSYRTVPYLFAVGQSFCGAVTLTFQ